MRLNNWNRGIRFTTGGVPIPVDENEIILFRSMRSKNQALDKLTKRTHLSIRRWSEGFTSKDFYENYPAHGLIKKDVEEKLIREIASRLGLVERENGVFSK